VGEERRGTTCEMREGGREGGREGRREKRSVMK